ncbi:MAG: glycosyltransferase involved in cell wall biosynthesis [Flavobacteriales bacterium]|jgi:glycosyltransferase involved in cell wall biosynthesis
MANPISISAAIICFNEERNIERCLNSLKGVVDEIVVVDSFSNDRTKEICLSHHVNFIEHPFEGHIQQKNYALSQTSNRMVISLDADEALTPELRESIINLKKDPKSAVYSMNRLTNYCGKWVRYCGWYPDNKVRLFDKIICQWGGVNPHDKVIVPEGVDVHFLNGDLLHYSYYTRDDHYRQIEYFSKIASTELYNRGKNVSLILVIGKVVAQFFKSFFLKLGFLDGMTGWTISRLSAYATYRKYSNLRKLNANEEI